MDGRGARNLAGERSGKDFSPELVGIAGAVGWKMFEWSERETCGGRGIGIILIDHSGCRKVCGRARGRKISGPYGRSKFGGRARSCGRALVYLFHGSVLRSLAPDRSCSRVRMQELASAVTQNLCQTSSR